MSEYIAKASIEPRDYRVVFLIQKYRTQVKFLCPVSLLILIDRHLILWISTLLYVCQSLIHHLRLQTKVP